MAARADVREELDRLVAHVEATRALIAAGGPSAASSTSWPRSSIARPTRSAPKPTTRADADRPGPQGGDRAVARAGAEHRVRVERTTTEATRASQRRGPDARALLAVGRGQDDARAAAAASRSRPRHVGLGDHPRRRGRARSTAVDYHFIDAREFERLRGQPASCSSGREVHGNFYGTPQAPVEAALAAGQRHAVRHRLAGRAAAQGRWPRRIW